MVVSKGNALRDRVAAGILDVAAAVLAARGDALSMGEVAEAAGVGRATLYRYFPTREALLAALADTALADLRERIADAQLETVAFGEGIARLARATATGNVRYLALLRDGGKLAHPEGLDEHVRAPLRAFFARAAAAGEIRADLPPEVLAQIFVGMLDAALRTALPEQLGVEAAAAAIAGVFLRGTLATGAPVSAASSSRSRSR